MPDNKIDQMIIFLHQNKGELANRKRKRFFEELTDIEIKTIESAYLQIFENKQIK